MFRLRRRNAPVIRSTVVAGDTLVIRLHGELNLERTQEVRPQLLKLAAEHAPRHVIINFEGVPYLDSTTLAALVELRNALRAAQPPRDLYLTDLSPRLRDVIRLARLDLIFRVLKTEQDAIE